MEQLNPEELYARSRALFVDLLKLGLSLSTGIVAALSFFVFNNDEPLNLSQIRWYNGCLTLLLFSIGFAIIGWLAQAMFYTAWAFYFPDDHNRRNKWRIIRNVSLGGFALLFLLGVIAAAVFISSFIKVRS